MLRLCSRIRKPFLLKGPTANVLARSRSNRGGTSSNNSNGPGEHFILPEAWKDRVLAEIKKDEEKIQASLLKRRTAN
jgi:hypothetical protein